MDRCRGLRFLAHFAVVLSCTTLLTAIATEDHPGSPAHAATGCAPAKLIGVRGSGDETDPRQLGVLVGPLYDGLAARLPQPSLLAYYGLPYPASAIAGVTLAAFNDTYLASKNTGRDQLRRYLRTETAVCPREKLVIVGYSQGAQVVADAFSKKAGKLPARVRRQVVAIELFGDPTFSSSEGFDRGTYSIERNGVLGPRDQGELTSVSSKVRSWCRADDVICQIPGSAAEHDASRYLAEFEADAVGFLIQRLGTLVVPTPSSG